MEIALAATSALAMLSIWGLVTVALLAKGFLGTKHLLMGAFFTATGVTLRQWWAFDFVEGLTGHRGVTVLLFEASSILAIMWLTWIGFFVMGGEDLVRRHRNASVTAAAVALAVLVCLFVGSDWHPTEAFMFSELHDWRAAAFTSVQWVAMAWMAIVGYLAVQRDFKISATRTSKATVILIGIGSLMATAAVLFQGLLVVLASTGVPAGDLLDWGNITINVSGAFIMGGLAVAPLAALPAAIRRDRRNRALLIRTYPLWRKLVDADSRLAMNAGAARLRDILGPASDRMVWRRRVEIVDVFSRTRVDLDEHDRAVLRELVGGANGRY